MKKLDSNKASNAGVHAQTGFAMQRNIALYLLLENYESKFKNKDYFICLEHHDDFLFCFLNEINEVEYIEAHQSKKKTSGNWTLNQLIDIIKKLLQTGKHLIEDKIPKSSNYYQILSFTTNQNIILGTNTEIKEDNISIEFKNLENKIQIKISNEIDISELKGQLQNLQFLFIDLNRTVKNQLNTIIGKMDDVFGDKIYSKKAAVQTILELFHEVEVILNNGNQVQLLDEKKRVTSKKINDTLIMLISKSKSFEYWRSQSSSVQKTLKIKPIEKETFRLTFESAFELFKDRKQVLHNSILNFVKNNLDNCTTFTEEENIFELIEIYGNRGNLINLEIKSIFYAAYFEATFKKETI